MFVVTLIELCLIERRFKIRPIVLYVHVGRLYSTLSEQEKHPDKIRRRTNLVDSANMQIIQES